MDIVVHMDLAASLVVLADKTAVGNLVVFPAIDNDVDPVVVDDFLGDQIVGDLNIMNLLMGHDVVEGVCPCCCHFCGPLAIEIGIDRGIDLLVLLVVMMTFG